ncbi:streptomycin biosynthesis enzyme StrG [Terasakiella sp. SH-1]|uniref:streptomycin biosynthesis enzyme StrG n=1 Tax=Terasakiella sp. SH-1 TaxID=2560057 RepID=UPI00197DD2B4|nr:streptomycin biosynthesis enzyme StrG [Terasakiella sp. SH-1]
MRKLNILHLSWLRQTGREALSYNDNMRLRKLMQRLPDDALFYKVYHKWIKDHIAPHYNNQISYSAHPKMRVHLAQTGCVSAFHEDADVTKREEQINCYLPFTDVYDGCSLFVETGYGKGDYEAINLKYGQALIWDGGRLRHGTRFNDTPTTRVSCDFRFKPLDLEHTPSPWCDVLADRPIQTLIPTDKNVAEGYH